MAIKRVDPGQAGAIGVGVRVPRSNAGDVLNAASDAVSRSAKGLDGIAGAVMNMGKAAEHAGDAAVRVKMQDAKLSQAKENEDHRVAMSEQAFKQKQAEAYFKTDSALAVIEYGKILDGLMAAERPDYDNPNFMHIASKNADNALQKLINASYAIVGSEGSNGIGARNRELTEGAMREKLNLLKQRYLAEANARWNKHRAEVDIGKEGTVLETMANSGVTDKESYLEHIKGSAAATHLTPTELVGMADVAWKAGCLNNATAKVNGASALAQNQFVSSFNALLEEGYSADYAQVVALEQAENTFLSQNINFDNVDEKDALKLQSEALRGLKATASSYKEKSNALLVEDLKGICSSGGTGNFRESKAFVDAINAESVFGDMDKTRETLGLSENEIVSFDSASVYTRWSNDLALLDLSNSSDRRKALTILNEAKVLSAPDFDALKSQFKAQVDAIGRNIPAKNLKPQIVAYLNSKGIEYTGKDSDSDDAKAVAVICLEYAKMNPLQWRQQVDNAVNEYNENLVFRNVPYEVGSIIAETTYSSSTGSAFVRGGRMFNVNTYKPNKISDRGSVLQRTIGLGADEQERQERISLGGFMSF